MSNLPYIQFNVSETEEHGAYFLNVSKYLATTTHLTTEEHGAYFLLLMNLCQRENPISEKEMQFITRLSDDGWMAVKQTLSEFFIINENGSWIN